MFFNKLAEIAGEYLHKGSKVYLEGSLRTRQWEKDGVKRYTTEIVASDMQMLDSRSGSDASSGQSPAPSRSSTATASKSPASSNDNPSASFDDFDDDIPF